MLSRMNARSVGRDGGNATCSATAPEGVGPCSIKIRIAPSYPRVHVPRACAVRAGRHHLVGRRPDMVWHEASAAEICALHTSGFPNAVMRDTDGTDAARRRAQFAQWRLEWEPGTRFVYHAAVAHWVLADLIERVTGSDYRDFIEARVCAPLGLPRVLGLASTIRARSGTPRYSVTPPRTPGAPSTTPSWACPSTARSDSSSPGGLQGSRVGPGRRRKSVGSPWFPRKGEDRSQIIRYGWVPRMPIV
jgi:hypothetical protein